MNENDFTLTIKSAWLEVVSVVEQMGQGITGWLSNNSTQVIAATLILLLAYVISILLGTLLRRILNRSGRPGTLIKFATGLTKYAIIILGLIVATYVLSLQQSTISLLAGLGILGVAIGFALQDLARDLVAGLFLILKQPFTDGELVQGGGYYGQVVQTDMRSTKIRTFSGQLVTIPNNDLFSLPIENFSRSRRRRLDLEIGIAYNTNLDTIRSVTQTALASLPDRQKNEHVRVFISHFNPSSIIVKVQIWLNKTAETNYLEAKHQAYILIKQNFDKNQIVIPFPISAIDYYQQGADKVLKK